MTQNWLHGVFLCAGVLLGLWLSKPSRAVSAHPTLKHFTEDEFDPQPAASEGKIAAEACKSSRAPSSVTELPAGLHAIEKMKFAEIAKYYMDSSEKFYDKNLDKYAQRMSFYDADPEKHQKYLDALGSMAALAERGSFWKGTGSLDDNGHHLEVEAVLQFQDREQKASIDDEDAALAVKNHTCYSYRVNYVLDGKSMPAFGGRGSCGPDMRSLENHTYIEDSTSSFGLAFPISLLLLPAPFDPAGQPQFYSNTSENWVNFDGFSWNSMSPEEVAQDEVARRAAFAAAYPESAD